MDYDEQFNDQYKKCLWNAGNKLKWMLPDWNPIVVFPETVYHLWCEVWAFRSP